VSLPVHDITSEQAAASGIGNHRLDIGLGVDEADADLERHIDDIERAGAVDLHLIGVVERYDVGRGARVRLGGRDHVGLDLRVGDVDGQARKGRRESREAKEVVRVAVRDIDRQRLRRREVLEELRQVGTLGRRRLAVDHQRGSLSPQNVRVRHRTYSGVLSVGIARVWEALLDAGWPLSLSIERVHKVRRTSSPSL